MKFGHLVPTSLVVVLFSTIANGMFNKDAAKSDPMASMVIGMLGKECETLYDKTMDKVDKVYHPAWDWVLGTCDKACGKSAEMQQAVPYLPYVFNFVDRLFIFMKKSSVALDIWKLCPRLLTKKVRVSFFFNLASVNLMVIMFLIIYRFSTTSSIKS